MRLDPETLDRLPDEGARVVCLALCADAEEAGRRVAGGEDEEALHDFRVALRRLRSALRAFAPLLGELVPGTLRKELRRLARATGPARDAEVLHGWLSGLAEAVPERYRPARDWLATRVEAARGEAYDQVEEELVPRFAELAPALAQRLAAGGGAPAGSPDTYGAALAGLLRGHVQAVRQALQAVEVPADAAQAHRARIEVKRLRYLLEPLRGNARADAGEAVRGLKALQEVLGQLSDAHQATAELGAALVVAAAERARGEGEAALRPGLLFVERLAAERAEGLFARLRDGWLGSGAGALLDEVFEVVARLEWRDAEEAEPEQRLLLSDLPAEGRGESEELWQGWLAGGREGFGKVAGREGERFFRSTSQGKGANRFEVVEEASRDEFEDYWPLTEGRRVHKRRHRPATAPGWAFDEYLDRKLVLAVAVDGGGATVPQWLEPAFVRDVTKERGYGDEALARRGGKGK